MIHKFALYTLLLLLACAAAGAQSANQPDSSVIHQGKYTLTFINHDPAFGPALKQRMVTTFFTVYPELAKTYKKNGPGGKNGDRHRL